ncbi:molybdate ABC transporter permease subunit [Chondromyces crocatus]|uniref:Molybdenum transport system permease n=1 Tax=Chondromyces crocatus TaxID=52 RepID=A0A0K1EEN5_CHOCO|nr:molybdate ABC transporter permease subunit [Chondromyces crocatus]AKT39335.1 molybdate ABC transporter permease [Chondromyces crocatus]
MTSEEAFPIGLSLRVAAIALGLAGPLGIGIAWVQARHRYPLRWLVEALVLLPLILPPSVIGYFLIVVFGRRGLVGPLLEGTFGVRLVFSPAGAVLASTVVALPLVVKTAQPAIEAVPPELEQVAKTLGLGPLSLLFRVTLPVAYRGVLAALVLGYARALGEFGATLMFAGNIPGLTNTMPLELFAAYQGGDDARAGLYVIVLTGMSLVVAFVAARLSPREITG